MIPLPTKSKTIASETVDLPKYTPQLGRLVPRFEPPRIVLNAVEGWGKTSLAANTPNPAIVMAHGETGYSTLLGVGLVPSVDAVVLTEWYQLIATIDALIASDTVYETLVIDAAGGFERMCHENVCKRDFRGDWGDRGFASYQKGYDLAVNDWLAMLARLDRLREEKNTAILMLNHCRIKTFKNPAGSDYDRWISDMHEKTWAATHKWADAALFGNFLSVIEKDRGGKGKGVGGDMRVLYTTRRDAFDAKNRYSLPPMLDMTDNPKDNWTMIYGHITKGAKNAE